MRTAALLGVLAACSTACSIPNTSFTATIDATPSIDGLVVGTSIVANNASLIVAEGKTAAFTVMLASPPNGGVEVTVTSSNAVSLPVSPPTLVFDPTNYSTPQTVTISAPVDSNTVDETAAIMLTSPGLASTSVAASVNDLTQLATYGWPTDLGTTTDIDPGTVIGFQVTVTTTATLASFGTYIPAAAGDFRMAIYSDNNNMPADLVASMPLRQTLINGANTAAVTAAPTIANGRYWVMFRDSASTSIGAAASQTGMQCYRDVNIANLDDAWPEPFGAATCTTSMLLNLSMTTYFQAMD